MNNVQEQLILSLKSCGYVVLSTDERCDSVFMRLKDKYGAYLLVTILHDGELQVREIYLSAEEFKKENLEGYREMLVAAADNPVLDELERTDYKFALDLLNKEELV